MGEYTITPENSKSSVWMFDILLAVLFPLCLLLVGRELLPPFSLSDIRKILTGSPFNPAPPFSLKRAYSAYMRYGALADQEVSSMERSYQSVGRSHKQLGFKIGYPTKLNRLKEAIAQNSKITSAIAELAAREFDLEADPPSGTNFTDLSRVRESLKHFVRDWSEEGANERETIFKPILHILNEVPLGDRATTKVLVPGSGLGRLAWEVSQLGFNTTAVEFSHFMSLAMRFLFSPSSTSYVNEHRIQPFAHWFSHQRSNESLFRSVSIPDVVPRLTPNLQLVEDDFLKLPAPPLDLDARPIISVPSSTATGYDFVITLFFIDTSINVFATIEKIHRLLRQGGVWINLGPLLWPGGAEAKVELSLGEVMHAVKEVGFVLHEGGSPDDMRAPRIVECEYTSDKNAMMRWLYHAEFWVATKH